MKPCKRARLAGILSATKIADVIGSMFYVMSYEQGRIYWDPALPELDNTQRSAIFDEMNRVLAAFFSPVFQFSAGRTL